MGATDDPPWRSCGIPLLRHTVESEISSGGEPAEQSRGGEARRRQRQGPTTSRVVRPCTKGPRIETHRALQRPSQEECYPRYRSASRDVRYRRAQLPPTLEAHAASTIIPLGIVSRTGQSVADGSGECRSALPTTNVRKEDRRCRCRDTVFGAGPPLIIVGAFNDRSTGAPLANVLASDFATMLTAGTAVVLLTPRTTPHAPMGRARIDD
jgi:hypothetical protein